MTDAVVLLGKRVRLLEVCVIAGLSILVSESWKIGEIVKNQPPTKICSTIRHTLWLVHMGVLTLT